MNLGLVSSETGCFASMCFKEYGQIDGFYHIICTFVRLF